MRIVMVCHVKLLLIQNSIDAVLYYRLKFFLLLYHFVDKSRGGWVVFVEGSWKDLPD